MKALLFLVLLSSCVLLQAQGETAQELPPSKQKQKIVLLEKKLKRAEKELRKVDEEVDRLSYAVKEAQLALIQRQVEDYQRKLQTHPQKFQANELAALFSKERQLLHGMILEGPSLTAFEAQKTLDQILEMITALSDGS